MMTIRRLEITSTLLPLPSNFFPSLFDFFHLEDFSDHSDSTKDNDTDAIVKLQYSSVMVLKLLPGCRDAIMMFIVMTLTVTTQTMMKMKMTQTMTKMLIPMTMKMTLVSPLDKKLHSADGHHGVHNHPRSS